ncbi:MAG: isocitrate/isopropylmalate family dehydrogenase, partial [Planctomycetota bacterium]
DLGAATVGGIGMSPSYEVGQHNGFFQASHGSAPTLVGRDLANPHGTILSAAFMLRWLGERHGDATLTQAADRIERAVSVVLANGSGLTCDIGGKAGTRAATAAVCRAAQAS